METFVQLVGSTLLLVSKYYIAKKKSAGWLLGIAGIVVLTYILYLRQFWVTMVMHAGLVVIMVYGLLLLNGAFRLLGRPQQFGLRAVFTFISVFLCIYFFVATYHLRNFGEWQLLHACTGLFGSLFLAFNTRRSNTAGWLTNIVGHFACIYYMGQSGLYWIVFFQVISIGISLWGIKNEWVRK